MKTRYVTFTLGGLIVSGCFNSTSDSEALVVEVADLRIASPELSFAAVRQVVASNNTLWVLNSVEPFVTGIARDDAHGVVEFGREGDGPGEARDPRALALTSSGIVIWDFSTGRWILVSPDGRYLSEGRVHRPPGAEVRSDFAEVSHLDPWRVRSFGDRFAFTRFRGIVTKPTDFALGSVGMGGADLQANFLIRTLADALPKDARAKGQFPWMPVWDACPDSIVVWEARSERLAWYSPGGREVRSLPMESGGVDISDRNIEFFLHAMARHEVGPGVDIDPVLISARVREVGPMFSQPAPPFADVRCGGDGTVWLRRFSLATSPLGQGEEWFRVGLDDQITAIRFPREFEPHVFLADEVVGVVADSAGDRLAAWRISHL